MIVYRVLFLALTLLGSNAVFGQTTEEIEEGFFEERMEKGQPITVTPQTPFDSHTVFLRVDEDWLPVVGVQGTTPVVRLENGERKRIPGYREIRMAIKEKASEVQVIIIGGTYETTELEDTYQIFPEEIENSTRTTFVRSMETSVDAVCNADLKDLYALFEARDESSNRLLSAGFAHIGKVVEGQRFSVKFRPEWIDVDQAIFHVRFFIQDLEIPSWHITRIGNLYEHSSAFLDLPFEYRLKRWINESSIRNSSPRPIHLHLPKGEEKPQLDVATLKVKAFVDTSGMIQLVSVNGQTSGETYSFVRQVIDRWRFLPAKKNGDPVDATITLPLVL